jgi:hypothetical protein
LEYLLGRLGEEDKDAFELHFLECAECFERLEALRALQGELVRLRPAIERAAITRARPRLVGPVVWAAGLAATLVMAVVGLRLWSGPGPVTRPSDSSPASSSTAPPPASAPPRPGPTSLEALASFDPPAYRPPTLRGEGAPLPALRSAMDRYTARDWKGAVAGLREAARGTPEDPEVLFFLGVAELLAGEPRRGVETLGQVVALGDSPYLEEARFYRAKGMLQRGDVAGARRELTALIGLQGDLEQQARALLHRLTATSPPAP